MIRRIMTEFVYPPIPQRTLDWCATFVGLGPTEDADLMEQDESLWVGYEEWLDTQAAAWDAEIDK